MHVCLQAVDWRYKSIFNIYTRPQLLCIKLLIFPYWLQACRTMLQRSIDLKKYPTNADHKRNFTDALGGVLSALVTTSPVTGGGVAKPAAAAAPSLSTSASAVTSSPRYTFFCLSENIHECLCIFTPLCFPYLTYSAAV